MSDHRGTPERRDAEARSARAIQNWVLFAFCAGASAFICAFFWYALANDTSPDPDEQAWLPFVQFVTVAGAVVVAIFIVWYMSLAARVRRNGR